jgi:PAS domain S-box-containing protein
MESPTKNQTENRLWLSEKANEAAKIGFWELNLLTNELYWSKITKVIHELDENLEPNLEKAILFYKEGLSRTMIEEAVKKAIETGVSYDLEIQIITHLGNEKWVRTIGQSIIEDGRCIRLFGTFQDIDEIKKARLALENQKVRNELILLSSGFGTWEWNVQTGETFFNEEWANIIGYTLADISPTNIETWVEFVHPDDLEVSNKRLQDCFDGKTPYYEMEARMRHKNGHWVWVYDRGMLISRTHDHKPLMMFGIHQDINKRKDQEKELYNILSLVKSQNTKLKSYSHIVNHNIRSHAGNIQRLLELALDTEEEEDKNELLSFTKTAAKNLLDTIGNLSKMANENEDISAQFEQISLLDVVKKAIENVYKANVVMSTEIPAGLFIHAIPAYADSIVLNLLTNAIKYHSDERNPWVKLSVEDEKDFTILMVKDNGLGIDLAKHGEKLFGMYQTFHLHKDSRGIGLFLTKTHIESMGGLIEVESEVNVGTTFKVFFKK